MRWLRALAGLLVLFAAGVAVLIYGFGMRVELAGSGMQPLIFFDDPEEHIAELERERTLQPPPEPEPPAAPAPAPREAAPTAPWPDYRGANRDGVIAGAAIRRDWPVEQVWRTKVGGGYASMIVAEGKIYTIEQRREQEVLAAYALRTGREVWTHAWDAYFQEAMGGPGPRATPTYAGGRIYALGAQGDFRSLLASNGELLWKTNILGDAGAKNLEWGMSAAPLIVEGLAIVQPGGADGKLLAAYDAESGRLVWHGGEGKASYASPHLVTLGGVRQAIVQTANRMMAIRPADGAELWSVDWPAPFDVNATQPIQIAEDRVWISSGGGHALFEVQQASSGWQARKVWENNGMKNKFNPSVLYEGHAYGLDNGILAAFDVATGERRWKGGRYGFGQLLLADGHLVVLTETGELALVKATPESHQEIARFQALQGKTWNVPAYADGLLLVRNQTEMAAYRLAP